MLWRHDIGRQVVGMKVDVKGFEIEVLRGSARALAERRISLIQIEWNAMSERALGTDRRPLADLLAKHGYLLYRPDLTGLSTPFKSSQASATTGRLVPVNDSGFGADVFAVPQQRMQTWPRDISGSAAPTPRPGSRAGEEYSDLGFSTRPTVPGASRVDYVPTIAVLRSGS